MWYVYGINVTATMCVCVCVVQLNTPLQAQRSSEETLSLAAEVMIYGSAFDLVTLRYTS